MTLRLIRPHHVFVMACAFVAALALSACGRKGPLELPPSATADPALNAAPQESTKDEDAANRTLLGSVSGQQYSKPVAPKGANKRIPLDVLLD